MLLDRLKELFPQPDDEVIGVKTLFVDRVFRARGHIIRADKQGQDEAVGMVRLDVVPVNTGWQDGNTVQGAVTDWDLQMYAGEPGKWYSMHSSSGTSMEVFLGFGDDERTNRYGSCRVKKNEADDWWIVEGATGDPFYPLMHQDVGALVRQAKGFIEGKARKALIGDGITVRVRD